MPRFRIKKRYILCFAGMIALLCFAFCLPKPLFDHPYSPVLYDRNGVLLGARVASDGQWRFPLGGALSKNSAGISDEKVNPKFAAAIIEFEDRRFRYHPGVDPLAVGRALMQNVRSGRVVSGASTITMQTVRLMRGGKKRTLGEKIIEAVLSLRLEIGRSKDDILSLYAANAPFGGNVVGLDAAAWRWYGRSASELSWGEAATLAVLPNSPSLVHPGRNRDTLKQKRDTLLDRLAVKGIIDEQTLLLAKAEALPEEARQLPHTAPHLFDRMIEERFEHFSGSDEHSMNELFAEPLVSTIDSSLQHRIIDILERSAYRFSGNNILNAACLVLDTETGEVLSYLGNVNSPVAGDVDIITSPRSSGSILKPFLYAAMLDSGQMMPGGLVSDIPTRIDSYRPENNTRTFIGVVPADEALARSLNIPAVRALRAYGVERFAALLEDLGITTLFRRPVDYGLPLILGGAEVTLWDISGLYAGLARTVMQTDTSASCFFPPIIRRQDSAFDLEQSAEKTKAKKAPISRGAAWLTLEALTEVVRPDEEAAWRSFASSRNIAWKTGTSFGFRDAWALGTTSKWTIAVWVGNATGEGRAELRGANTAAPVLFEVFSALSSSPWFQKPSGAFRSVEVCAHSGYPAGADCENVKYVDVPRNAPFHEPCPFCKTLILNESLDRQLVLSADTVERTVAQKWFVLPPSEEWYYRRWNLDYRPPPPFASLDGNPRSGGGSSDSVFPMAVFNPEENAQVIVPVELDGTDGMIVFMAAHRDSDAVIHWHLDGSYLGATTLFHEMEAHPAPGPHTLTIVDSSGNTLSRRFSVPDKIE